jgi:ATP-dependent 26S proteasome regulatory subunit
VLFVPAPDFEARESILKIFAKKMPTADDVDFSKLAKMVKNNRKKITFKIKLILTDGALQWC